MKCKAIIIFATMFIVICLAILYAGIFQTIYSAMSNIRELFTPFLQWEITAFLLTTLLLVLVILLAVVIVALLYCERS